MSGPMRQMVFFSAECPSVWCTGCILPNYCIECTFSYTFTAPGNCTSRFSHVLHICQKYSQATTATYGYTKHTKLISLMFILVSQHISVTCAIYASGRWTISGMANGLCSFKTSTLRLPWLPHKSTITVTLYDRCGEPKRLHLDCLSKQFVKANMKNRISAILALH